MDVEFGRKNDFSFFVDVIVVWSFSFVCFRFNNFYVDGLINFQVELFGFVVNEFMCYYCNLGFILMVNDKL